MSIHKNKKDQAMKQRKRLWDWLIGTNPRLAASEDSQGAKLFTILMSIHIVLIILFVIVVDIIWESLIGRAIWNDKDAWVVLGGAVLIGFSLALVKLGFYKIGVLIYILITDAVAIMAPFVPDSDAEIGLLASAIIPILLAAMVFSYRWVLVLLIGTISVSITQLLMSSLPERQIGTGFALLVVVGVTGSLILVFRHYFSRMEAERLDELKQATNSLKESEEKYRLLVENASEAIVIVQDMVFKFANSRMFEFSGYSEYELISKPFLELVHPEDRERLLGYYQKRVNGEQVPSTYSFRALDCVGNTKWAEINPVLINWEGRLAILALLNDITERKRAEESLIKSEKLYRDAIEAAGAVPYIKAYTDNSYEFIGDGIQSLTGYNKEEFTPDLWNSMIQEIKPFGKYAGLPAGEAFRKSMEERANILYWDVHIISRYGEDRWISDSSIQMRNEKGKLVSELGILQDVTDRKLAEETLRNSEQKFRNLVEQLPDGIMIVNENGVIIDANKSLERIIGLKCDKIIGRYIWDIQFQFVADEERKTPELYEFFKSKTLGKLGSGQISIPPRLVKIKRLDGICKIIVESGFSIQTKTGTVIGRIIHDITDQHNAEEQLRDSNSRLEKALAELKMAQQQVIQQERLRALGQLASGIAHDFNNALTPILGYSDLLLSSPMLMDNKEKARKYIELINIVAEDAKDVVNRLREFYRNSEEGEVFEPTNLNNIINQSIELTEPKWKNQAQANGVTINILTELGEIPNINGIQAELREMMINLIFNAVDAMQESGTISLWTQRLENNIIFEISDTGIGMSDEVMQRCFEPFFSTKDFTGTGLGLSIAHGIIRRHKGTISVESKEGEGTKFIITIPISEETEIVEKSQIDGVSPKHLHVLVVDDEPLIQNMLSEYLSIDGHTCKTASNGREGLSEFRNGKFDLVITDRAMPDISGDQLAEIIKETNPDMPIIMITGFGNLMKASGEMPNGIDYLMSKPITLGAFKEAISNVIPFL